MEIHGATGLPYGNALLSEFAFDEICDELQIHRNGAARRELREALSKLHAESF